jgi:hypothetical protein
MIRHQFMFALPIVAGLVSGAPAAAAIYSVGSGPGCTHASIQAAVGAASVTAADDEIRLSATLAYAQQALLVDEVQGTLTIAGGFASCSDAAPVAGARTPISGNGNLPVLRINATRTVSLQSLDISGGGTSERGGGIYVTGSGGAVLAIGKGCNGLGRWQECAHVGRPWAIALLGKRPLGFVRQCGRGAS